VGEPHPRFPYRKQMLLPAFVRQVDRLAREHPVRGVADVLAGSALPPDAVLLTFDDGLRDHVEHVLPLLVAKGLPATFFVPAGVLDGRVLPVHRIQAVLAATADHASMLPVLADAVGRDAAGGLRARFGAATRFDHGATALLKGFLQRGPRPQRDDALAVLYERYVGVDEATLAGELYLSRADLHRLVAAGMTIGGHGLDHEWLSTLDAAAQEREIAASRALATRFHQPWTFAYPYGDYDATSLALLEAYGCALAFTTEPAPASLDRPLELARLDCVDVPM